MYVESTEDEDVDEEGPRIGTDRSNRVRGDGIIVPS